MRAQLFRPVFAILLSALGLAAAAAQERDLAAAYNATGRALFRQFGSDANNIVFSPTSIGTAMAMALAGARDKTEAEMLSVFKLTLSRTDVEAANAKLMAAL